MPQRNPIENALRKTNNPTVPPCQSRRPRNLPTGKSNSKQEEEPEPRLRSKLERTKALLGAALHLWELKRRI